MALLAHLIPADASNLRALVQLQDAAGKDRATGTAVQEQLDDRLAIEEHLASRLKFPASEPASGACKRPA
jgi:hypothetical protein